MIIRSSLFIVFAFAASLIAAPEKLAAGKGRFDFNAWDGPVLPVWYYTPKSLTAETPVLFVLHGLNRNGDEYRDQWIESAERYGFVLVVPTFSKRDFPDRAGYNFGNVFTEDGKRRPVSQWGYTAIERIFDHVRQAATLSATTYLIYGHSAGAQFVHRMPYFLPTARVGKIVSANAGAYMLPSFQHDFPYGLKGSGVTETDLQSALQKPVVVLLGEADTDPKHESIPNAPEAKAQGLHRFRAD